MRRAGGTIRESVARLSLRVSSICDSAVLTVEAAERGVRVERRLLDVVDRVQHPLALVHRVETANRDQLSAVTAAPCPTQVNGSSAILTPKPAASRGSARPDHRQEQERTRRARPTARG